MDTQTEGGCRRTDLAEELVAAQAAKPGYPRYLLGAAHFPAKHTTGQRWQLITRAP